MDKFKLEIVTPHGEIFNSDVKSVIVPGVEGEFGVLPNHSFLISLLSAGVITIENIENKKELIAIDSGHIKVSEKNVVILAQGAVYLGGDANISQNKLDAAYNLLASASADSMVLAAAISQLDKK